MEGILSFKSRHLLEVFCRQRKETKISFSLCKISEKLGVNQYTLLCDFFSKIFKAMRRKYS